MSVRGELSPTQATQYLRSLASNTKQIQETARSVKSALRHLDDKQGSKTWYKKQMAIRNYDARVEMVVMTIWKIEPTMPGYLDCFTVTHVTDIVRKLATDTKALVAVAAERGVVARELKSQAQKLENDIVRLSAS